MTFLIVTVAWAAHTRCGSGQAFLQCVSLGTAGPTWLGSAWQKACTPSTNDLLRASSSPPLPGLSPSLPLTRVLTPSLLFLLWIQQWQGLPRTGEVPSPQTADRYQSVAC